MKDNTKTVVSRLRDLGEGVEIYRHRIPATRPGWDAIYAECEICGFGCDGPEYALSYLMEVHTADNCVIWCRTCLQKERDKLTPDEREAFRS